MITDTQPVIDLESSIQHAFGFFNTLMPFIAVVLGIAFLIFLFTVIIPRYRDKKLLAERARQRKYQAKYRQQRRWRSNVGLADRQRIAYLNILSWRLFQSPNVQEARANREAAFRMMLWRKPERVYDDRERAVWGNQRTMIVHYSGCPEIMSAKGLRSFDRVEEALAEGFRKCEVCID